MAKRYNNILETIGNTPIVKINKLAPSHVNLFVKIESFNPMGSVKDRLALGVIEDAERRGELKPGQTIIEATSGNTGIGLAMVCAQKGYPLVVTMAESFSVERRKLMRFLGAQVILTPASEKGSGMVAKAKELAEKHGWWQSRQFENPANAEIHRRTTAREILDDFADVGLDYWVSGFGTAGTMNGVASVLKKESLQTKIVVCEPDNSAMLASGIPQSRDANGKMTKSHPNFRPHLMQGWSPDFISDLAEDVMQQQLIDELVAVSGNDAMYYAKKLATAEGIFVGTSSGATFAAALKVAEQAALGSNILCMLPDTGERYLSTPLFEDIQSDMNEAEMAISQSTDAYRFDVPSATPAAPSESEAVSPDIQAAFEDMLQENKVVMFALEWCEFCWSLRKLFSKIGLEYSSIDLDSATMQKDNHGGLIRAALRNKTQCNTLPQVFINGKFIGGCTDTFDAYKSGNLQKQLQTSGIDFNQVDGLDPYSLLPKWLHAR